MKTLQEKLEQAFQLHKESGPEELAQVATRIVYGHFRHAAHAADRIARETAIHSEA